MNPKTLGAAALAALVLAFLPSAARADDPAPGTVVEKPRHDNTPPDVTDTPPGDFGPVTNSIRRPAYRNLLGDTVIPYLDNGLGQSALRLSGYLWADLGYMASSNQQPGLYDQKASYMQGRFVFRAEYERFLVSDFFATARVEFIGMDNEYTKSTYEPHTLEMYAKIGQKHWDVQVGRFYPFMVYYRGLGVDLYTPEETGAAGSVPPIYHVNYAWGLQDEPGQVAVHLFPIDGLGIEVSGVYGQNGTSGLNTYAARPVVDWKQGGLEVVAGGEYFVQRPQRSEFKVQQTQYGFGGRAQYTFWLLTAGLEGSYAHSEKINIDETQDGQETYHRYTVGGWVDLYFWNDILSVGLHHTADSRLNGDKPTQQQGYVAFIHRLPLRGLSLKFVYGIGLGHVDDATSNAKFDNKEQSARVRLQYLFQ